MATSIKVQAVEVVGEREVMPLSTIKRIQDYRKMAKKDGACSDNRKGTWSSKPTGADTSKDRSVWIWKMKENSGLTQDSLPTEVTRKMSGMKRENAGGTARKQMTDMKNQAIW